jgi:hypothetical protein
LFRSSFSTAIQPAVAADRTVAIVNTGPAEATALIADDSFARKVEAMLHADLELCEPVARAHFDEKPLWFCVAARIARLASPLL